MTSVHIKIHTWRTFTAIKNSEKEFMKHDSLGKQIMIISTKKNTNNCGWFFMKLHRKIRCTIILFWGGATIMYESLWIQLGY